MSQNIEEWQMCLLSGKKGLFLAVFIFQVISSQKAHYCDSQLNFYITQKDIEFLCLLPIPLYEM